MNNHYIYRHIRVDTNEVFYIGKGSGLNYKRSFSTRDRNKFWHNIVNKTSFEIDIVADNLSHEEAFKKEVEFIKLYGRRDLGTGTLVNLTSGGEGVVGNVISEDIRKKCGLHNIGRVPYNKGQKLSEEHKLKLSLAKKGCKFWEGKKHSEESKLKMRLAKLGKPSNRTKNNVNI